MNQTQDIPVDVPTLNTPTIEGISRNALGAALSLPGFWSIIDAGDPKSTGLLGKMLNGVIKWGDSQIPKNLKTALDVYKVAVDVTSALPMLALGLLSASTLLVDMLIKSGRLSAANRDKAILDTKNKMEQQLNDINSANEFLKNSNEVDTLTSSQKKLIEETIILDPTEDENVKLALKENMYGILDIDPEKAATKEYIVNIIKSNRDAGEVLNIIYGDSIDNDTLRKINIYINTVGVENTTSNQHIGELSTSIKSSIDSYLSSTSDSNLRKAILRKHIARIIKLREQGKPSSKIREQRQRALKLVDRLSQDPKLLISYQEAYLAGTCYDITRFDERLALPPQIPDEASLAFKGQGFIAGELNGTSPEYKDRGYNPLMYLNFATTPTPKEVSDEKVRIDAIVKGLPAYPLNFIKERFSYIIGRSKFSSTTINDNLEVLSGMSLEEIINLKEISSANSSINDPSNNRPLKLNDNGVDIDIVDEDLIKELKDIFSRTRLPSTSLYDELLSLRVKMENDSSLYGAFGDKEKLLAYIKKFENFTFKYIDRDDAFFGDGTSLNTPTSLVNFIGYWDSALGPNVLHPTLVEVYEGLDGNLKELFNKQVDSEEAIRTRFNNKLKVVTRLEGTISSNSGLITTAHIDHLSRLCKGDISLEGINIDSLGYIAMVKDKVSLIFRNNEFNVLKDSLKNFDVNSLNLPDLSNINYRVVPPVSEIELENGGKLWNLKQALSILTTQLHKRLSDLNYAFINKVDITEDPQNEIRIIQELLGILSIFGPEKNTSTDNNLPAFIINDNIFKMYLNGLGRNISKGGDITEIVVKTGMPGLKIGSANKYSLPPTSSSTTKKPTVVPAVVPTTPAVAGPVLPSIVGVP